MHLIKPLFLIFLLLTILLLADFCFAQRGMEVPLPEMSSEELPFLPDYVKYIFNFAIGIAGLVAFVMVVYGGVRYLTSAGNPSAMADANDRIFAGLIGLIVILGSWLLLTTINPQLIVLRAERGPSPEAEEIAGVYLCKDSAGTDCQVFNSSKDSIGDLNDKVKYIKFKNTEEDKYGAVLHQDKNYEGRCAICLSDGCNDGYNNIAYVHDVSSIHVFIQVNSSPGEGVTLYEIEDYNRRCGNECYQNCPAVGKCGDNCSGVINKGPGSCWGPFTEKDAPNFDSQKAVWSIEIVEQGRWLAALFTGGQYQHNCEIFAESDPNFKSGDNYLGRKRIQSLIVLPIKLLTK